MFTLSPAIALVANLLAPSVIIGFLIGFGGVGGLLLAPALNVIGGIAIHDAIRLCMFVYVTTGVIGTAVFMRKGYIRAPILIALVIGAGPGALLGTLLLDRISAVQLEILLAVVIFATGLHAIFRDRTDRSERMALSNAAYIAIGVTTGFGSAITGTGGPLILLPILLFARLEAKQAVGLAQAIQIPIGLLATAGNMLTGGLDFSLGMLLSVAVGLGVLVGALRSHRSSNGQIQTFLGVALILTALVYAAHSLAALLPDPFGKTARESDREQVIAVGASPHVISMVSLRNVGPAQGGKNEALSHVSGDICCASHW